MSYRLIGVAGPAHSGKDALADYIIKKRPDYRKASFADPMKRVLGKTLGLTSSQLYGAFKEDEDDRYGCSPRHMLQTLGTEWGRNLIHPDIWVTAMDWYLSHQSHKSVFIIPDVRFENEAAFVREHGTLIHILGRNQGIGADHISEAGVIREPEDIYLTNSSLINTFYDHIDILLRQIPEIK